MLLFCHFLGNSRVIFRNPEKLSRKQAVPVRRREGEWNAVLLYLLMVGSGSTVA